MKSHTTQDVTNAVGRVTHEPQSVERLRRRHYPRWARVAGIATVLAGATWLIGHRAAKRIESQDIEVATRRQAPAAGFPAASRTADHNNLIMRMGYSCDLDGQAVAYTSEANHLVHGGTFRTDFSLDELARLLRVGPDSIADPAVPLQVNPDAELFRAQAGTLTEKSKEKSRKLRTLQIAEKKRPDAVLAEWAITNYSFTLRRLKQPSDNERAILAAIIVAAAETMPMPGDGIRAVAVNRDDLEGDGIAVAAGMLPLEALSSAGKATPGPAAGSGPG